MDEGSAAVSPCQMRTCKRVVSESRLWKRTGEETHGVVVPGARKHRRSPRVPSHGIDHRPRPVPPQHVDPLGRLPMPSVHHPVLGAREDEVAVGPAEARLDDVFALLLADVLLHDTTFFEREELDLLYAVFPISLAIPGLG